MDAQRTKALPTGKHQSQTGRWRCSTKQASCPTPRRRSDPLGCSKTKPAQRRLTAASDPKRIA